MSQSARRVVTGLQAASRDGKATHGVPSGCLWTFGVFGTLLLVGLFAVVGAVTGLLAARMSTDNSAFRPAGDWPTLRSQIDEALVAYGDAGGSRSRPAPRRCAPISRW